MLPMRFAFYQDIERARHNPFELDALHKQIVGCGNGYEGDLFHLAHVPGVHTKSIIGNAIDRAEEEGEPLYAALMMMADIDIDPVDWDRLVGIVASAEDVEVLWNVFRLCGTYARVMCEHDRPLEALLLAVVDRTDRDAAMVMVEDVCSEFGEWPFQLEECIEDILKLDVDAIRDVLFIILAFDDLNTHEYVKPLVQRVFDEGDLLDTVAVHGLFGLMVDQSPAEVLMNQPEPVSIESWHDYWVTLKRCEGLSDAARLGLERQRILSAVLKYPATDMVLFLLHTEGSAFPIVWQMLAAKIAENEGGVEMLLPLVELLADHYEAFSTDSARPELLPHIQERLVPVLNIIQCVGFESVSSEQADFLRGVMKTHGVAYQAA